MTELIKVKTKETKTCGKCGVKKPLTEFYRNNSRKDGYEWRCKACQREYDEQRSGTLHRKAQRALSDARRAARKVEVEQRREVKDTLTLAEVKTVLAQKECTYCGKQIKDQSERTLDHVTPIQYGGTNSFDNITMACRSCNSAKNDLPIILLFMRQETEAETITALLLEIAARGNMTFPEAFKKLVTHAKNYFDYKTEKALERAEKLQAEQAEKERKAV